MANLYCLDSTKAAVSTYIYENTSSIKECDERNVLLVDFGQGHLGMQAFGVKNNQAILYDDGKSMSKINTNVLDKAIVDYLLEKKINTKPTKDEELPKYFEPGATKNNNVLAIIYKKTIEIKEKL